MQSAEGSDMSDERTMAQIEQEESVVFVRCSRELLENLEEWSHPVRMRAVQTDGKWELWFQTVSDMVAAT